MLPAWMSRNSCCIITSFWVSLTLKDGIIPLALGWLCLVSTFSVYTSWYKSCGTRLIEKPIQLESNWMGWLARMLEFTVSRFPVKEDSCPHIIKPTHKVSWKSTLENLLDIAIPSPSYYG